MLAPLLRLHRPTCPLVHHSPHQSKSGDRGDVEPGQGMADKRASPMRFYSFPAPLSLEIPR